MIFSFELPVTSHSLQSATPNASTGTKIMFADAGDPNIPNLKKSNITISCSNKNVYIPRQELMVNTSISYCLTTKTYK